jgi:DNA-binding NtrC family response regulator
MHTRRNYETYPQEPELNSADLHILIAEDEISHAVVLRRRLEREFPDARIEVVASIRDYQSSIAAALPTIALLDLNLSDGCSLDMLKASPASPLFPVVMMSSYASKQVAADALQAGAMDFILKSPEVFSSIADIVEKTVREWSLRAEQGGDRQPLP